MSHDPTMRNDINDSIGKLSKKKKKRKGKNKKVSASNVGGAAVGGGT